MHRQELGSTGLRVSPLGLGCVTFGREIEAAAAFEVLDRARESGINLLDTAAAYHGGASEQVLGAWLADRRCRNEFVVATKVAPPLSRERILASAAESLKRLRVESIDLYQLHAWDEGTPVEETLLALEQLRREGKILHAGCSNWSAGQLREADTLGGPAPAPRIATVQPPHNLVQREIEGSLLPLCRERRIGVLAYSPLAAGFLTGKYRRGGPIPAGARFDVIPGHQPIYFTERGWAVLEGLESLARREGRSMAELAMGWALARSRKDALGCVLVGARHPGHIDQALAAESAPLPEAVYAALDAL